MILAGVARGDVPDASLRAVKDRAVRLERDGAPAIEGRVLALDAASVTIDVSTTHEVITAPRDKLLRVILIDAAAEEPPAPEQPRMWGISAGLPGVVQGDVDYGPWHAFASANVLLPILSDSRWIDAAVGGGVAIPIGASRWKVDAFGEVLPLHATSFYTYLAFGIGAGFHYTAPSGFTVAFTLPVLGFATRLGHSPYGYDGPFRYNDSLGYYYLAAFGGAPLVTMGYRFATRCPRNHD